MRCVGTPRLFVPGVFPGSPTIGCRARRQSRAGSAPALVEALTAKLKTAGHTRDFHYYLAHYAFGNEQAVGQGRIAGTRYDPG